MRVDVGADNQVRYYSAGLLDWERAALLRRVQVLLDIPLYGATLEVVRGARGLRVRIDRNGEIHHVLVEP